MKAIYRPYLANPCPENMPILSDLHQALLDQHLPEADRVAQALDLYVSGSLNVFNHKTNVDIHNRLVAFDIKELGKSFNRFLIISLDVLICRYSPLFRAFPALFISEEPHKSFYYPSCFRSQK